MKIASIAYELGKQIVTNDEIVEKVKTHSTNFTGDLDQTLDQIKFYLSHGGAHERRWLTDEQRPIDMVCNAAERALDEAGLEKKDIGLILHVGLGRAFMEAGQSYFIAQALDMNHVHCFDIMDACNSWSRAMFMSYNLLKTNAYQNILIVNTECNMLEGGIANPTCFNLTSAESVQYSFAGMTLGDGVSATVLSAADFAVADNWDFSFVSRPDLADICAVPFGDYEKFAKPSEHIAVNGKHKFTSFAVPMNKIGYPICLRMMKDLPLEKLKRVFCHGHQKNVWLKMIQQAGSETHKCKWNTYENIGNLASACVPVALKIAQESGDIQRGDYVATLVGSGGMSFSTIAFTF